MIQTTKKNRGKTEQHLNRRKPVARSPKLPPTPRNGTNQGRRGRSSLSSSHQTTLTPGKPAETGQGGAPRRRRRSDDDGGGGHGSGDRGSRGRRESGRGRVAGSAARPLLLLKTARRGRWKVGGPAVVGPACDFFVLFSGKWAGNVRKPSKLPYFGVTVFVLPSMGCLGDLDN